jgi:uncharacterized protein (TIGR02444 family)
MSESARRLDDASWAFALRVYAEPGVAPACLGLQVEAGVDVTMMLVAAFAAARCGIVVSSSEIAQMDALCRPWREQVVQPLRALRIALKSGPAPAPGRDTEPLRTQIKSSELTAERLQNDLLAAWLQAKLPECSGVRDDDLRLVLRAVILFALQRRAGQLTADMVFAVDEIAAAVRRIPA